MRIIVCDDESAIRIQIQGLIFKEDKDAEVILCQNAEEVLANPDADLIMLDIQLDGISGIEAARRLRLEGNETPIIFISGIKNYVFEAFDVGAFWYLIKPIDDGQFHHVFEKVRDEIARKSRETDEPLVFETRRRKYSLKRGQILYAENDGKKIILHTASEPIELYSSMAEMEAKLGGTFFRCHRGYLVNMNHISSYSRDGIIMSNGDEVYLSRERYREFVEGYMSYLQS